MIESRGTELSMIWTNCIHQRWRRRGFFHADISECPRENSEKASCSIHQQTCEDQCHICLD